MKHDFFLPSCYYAASGTFSLIVLGRHPSPRRSTVTKIIVSFQTETLCLYCFQTIKVLNPGSFFHHEIVLRFLVENDVCMLASDFLDDPCDDPWFLHSIDFKNAQNLYQQQTSWKIPVLTKNRGFFKYIQMNSASTICGSELCFHLSF